MFKKIKFIVFVCLTAVFTAACSSGSGNEPYPNDISDLEFGVYPTFIAEIDRQPLSDVGAISTHSADTTGNPLAKGATEAVTPSGSGYDEVEGTIVNYEYVGFGGFYLQVKDRKIKWKGFIGSFTDIISEVDPQVSKIADNIYMFSWAVSGDGGDNVVMNFNEMKVFGHLSQGGPIDMISGEIYCVNQSECHEPEGEPMGSVGLVLGLWGNSRGTGKSIQELIQGVAGEADYQGREALQGQKLVYETDSETITLTFLDADTSAELSKLDPEELASNQVVINGTIITDGIYFISWRDGAPGDNHIIYNSYNQKIYDQIADDGERFEMIFNAVSFGPAVE